MKGNIIYCIISNNKIFSNKKVYSQIMLFENFPPSKHIVEMYHITKFKCIFSQIMDYYWIKYLYV